MKSNRAIKNSIFLILAVLLAAPLHAAYNRYGIPDSSEIRKTLVEKWFEAPLESVRLNAPEFHANSAGQKFMVSLEEADDTYNIMVSACTTIKMNIVTDQGTQVKEQDMYPGDIPGSFILIKDKKTDNPLRIRFYFAKDSDVYVQFSPKGRTALADMLIYGNYASKGVSTGLPFSAFYTASFDDVVKMTEKSLPWSYVTVKNNSYSTVLQMAGMIQKNLGRVVLTDDAMYDSTGLVSISTGKPLELPQSVEGSEEESEASKLYLSSAGFVKWIADGIVEPAAGAKLKRDPLLEETVQVKENGHQGVASGKYSLYFSLDWIRNLASAVVSVQTGRQYRFNNSGVDVTVNPFASSISKDGQFNTVTFIENTGYNIDLLKSLLYVLAAKEPGIIYFGAIRETDRTVVPELKVFNDCVAFLPYFDSSENFRCFVFMNGRQMTLEDFCQIYKKDFVYLTKVRSDERFFPE